MRRLIVVLICLGLMTSAWLILRQKSVAVDFAEVVRGDLVVVVRDDGQTRIREKYVISAPLSGRLVRVDLEPGDSVMADQTPVAVIQPTDPSLLDPRALAEARARVQAAEVRVAQMAPRIKLAQEKLSFAELEVGRFRSLARKGASTGSDLDAAELNFDAARSEYADVTFAQQIADFELQLAKAALIHTDADANTTGSDYQLTIRSPINGNVLRVFEESSTVISAGAALLEIGDPSDLEVQVDVLSTDAVQIRPGARVLLDQWGGEDTIEGKVRLIEPAAFTKVSALGIEEQRVNIIIDLVTTNRSLGLGDGYRVDANIVIWEGKDRLKVPVGAMFRFGEDWAAFVNLQGRAIVKKIKIGHRNDNEAEVLDGLAEGDLVVMHPGDQLQEGDPVQRRNN